MKRLLIVKGLAADEIRINGEAGATVAGATQEVAEADIVITDDGRLLKDSTGEIEVRVV